MFKLLSQGFESFTGDLGNVDFVDGVTHDELDIGQVNRLGSNFILEKVLEDGRSFQVGPCPVGELAIEFMAALVAKRVDAQEVIAPSVDATDSNDLTDEEPPVGKLYTREQLEAIADKKGIAGLREIAEPLKIKGTSVLKLINALLNVSAG